jgi:hypothetical protein
MMGKPSRRKIVSSASNRAAPGPCALSFAICAETLSNARIAVLRAQNFWRQRQADLSESGITGARYRLCYLLSIFPHGSGQPNLSDAEALSSNFEASVASQSRLN